MEFIRSGTRIARFLISRSNLVRSDCRIFRRRKKFLQKFSMISGSSEWFQVVLNELQMQFFSSWTRNATCSETQFELEFWRNSRGCSEIFFWNSFPNTSKLLENSFWIKFWRKASKHFFRIWLQMLFQVGLPRKIPKNYAKKRSKIVLNSTPSFFARTVFVRKEFLNELRGRTFVTPCTTGSIAV
jgi:hypothetical protein